MFLSDCVGNLSATLKCPKHPLKVHCMPWMSILRWYIRIRYCILLYNLPPCLSYIVRLQVCLNRIQRRFTLARLVQPWPYPVDSQFLPSQFGPESKRRQTIVYGLTRPEGTAKNETSHHPMLLQTALQAAHTDTRPQAAHATTNSKNPWESQRLQLQRQPDSHTIFVAVPTFL